MQDLPSEFQVEPDFMDDHLDVNENPEVHMYYFLLFSVIKFLVFDTFNFIQNVIVPHKYIPDHIENRDRQNSTAGADSSYQNM